MRAEDTSIHLSDSPGGISRPWLSLLIIAALRRNAKRERHCVPVSERMKQKRTLYDSILASITYCISPLFLP